MFRIGACFASSIFIAIVSIGCGDPPSAQVHVDAPQSLARATPTSLTQALVPLTTPTGDITMNTPDDTTSSSDYNDSGIIPGSLPSSPPQSPDERNSEDMIRQPTEWLTYANPSFGFSIEYPNTYVVIDTADNSTHEATSITHSFHFQDIMLAQSETANLQPPQFAIDIFEVPSDMSFEQWIDSNVTLSGSTRDAVEVGDYQGYVVSLPIQLAPNQFYYVAGDNYYYKLTSLGLYADRMLGSFTIDI